MFLKCNFSLVVKHFSAFGPIVQPSGSHIWIIANTLQFINFVNLILDLEFISLTMPLDFGDTRAGRVGLTCDNVLDHSWESPLGTNVLLSKCGDWSSQESEWNKWVAAPSLQNTHRYCHLLSPWALSPFSPGSMWNVWGCFSCQGNEGYWY